MKRVEKERGQKGDRGGWWGGRKERREGEGQRGRKSFIPSALSHSPLPLENPPIWVVKQPIPEGTAMMPAPLPRGCHLPSSSHHPFPAQQPGHSHKPKPHSSDHHTPPIASRETSPSAHLGAPLLFSCHTCLSVQFMLDGGFHNRQNGVVPPRTCHTRRALPEMLHTPRPVSPLQHVGSCNSTLSSSWCSWQPAGPQQMSHQAGEPLIIWQKHSTHPFSSRAG